MSELAVTGIGVIAPTGIGLDAFWKAAEQGNCVLDRVDRLAGTGYPVRVAGEVRGFDPAEALEGRIIVQTDLFTQFALAAADLALTDAGLDPSTLDPFEVGVVTASYSGGVEFGQREIQALWRDGPDHVGPYQSIAWFYAASTGQISIRRGLKGPCGVLVTDEAGGLDAIAHAGRAIRRGARAMLVGGTEAPLSSPFALACQFGTGLLSASDDPYTAYLPFTDAAAGYVPAEGGALFVLEDRRAAEARGGEVWGVVAGHGTTFSGLNRFDPGGEGLVAAIRAALAEAGCAPEEVDVVFADAVGTRAADDAEAAAIRAVLGANVPVTAPKTGYGRGYAASAALDVAAALASLEHGVVPPTPNVTATRVDLDVVTHLARRVEPRSALVLARGLGGSNSALLLRRASG
ncbi:putative polyketide beta-ketoacyl synthase 2 [Gandjariella thermophila]|uniref:Putative polyketide beta-ketoacyl synthase 2 n=1 Tax=Gandjariella thermophila TaxID=1931992 RepID=A0A4D4J6X3_9PSEU|nr:putative polyketide beta-ketoacyl synthase 2 [Gandjariella thermophila]